MKKRTIAIIVAVLVVLLLGAYMMFDNLFPKAEPIKQLEIDMIESISLSDNDGNEIAINDAEWQKLLIYINAAEPTRTMSVNDYPSARPYYIVEVKTEERTFGYMIYEENGVAYVELPYEGVYKIDKDAVAILK